MRKIYESPSIEVVEIEIEGAVLDLSNTSSVGEYGDFSRTTSSRQ